MSDIGKKLKQIRIAKNKTQLEVAEHLGVSRNAYTNWEVGTRRVNAEQLVALANYFGVTLDYFNDSTPDKTAFELLTQISAFFDSENICEEDKDRAYQDIMKAYLSFKENNK